MHVLWGLCGGQKTISSLALFFSKAGSFIGSLLCPLVQLANDVDPGASPVSVSLL